jgi:hypothetical protein
MSAVAMAASEAVASGDVYSPHAGVDYPTRVLWGDTHLHTNNSFDARAMGVTLDAQAAYRFARSPTTQMRWG